MACLEGHIKRRYVTLRLLKLSDNVQNYYIKLIHFRLNVEYRFECSAM